MIRSARCANSSTLSTLFSAASSHCSTSCFVFLLSFCFSPTFALISAEETSQRRSCQSRTWGSACWECFWGCCWRCPLTDPTLCLGHPGGTKVGLDYSQCCRIGLIKVKQLSIWFSVKCEWAKKDPRHNKCLNYLKIKAFVRFFFLLPFAVWFSHVVYVLMMHINNTFLISYF